MAFEEWQRKQIFARANAKCEHCGKKWGNPDFAMLECDHIVPLSMGGENHVDNGQLLCRRCHAKKHMQLAKEAKRRGDKKAYIDNDRAARMIARKSDKRYGYEDAG